MCPAPKTFSVRLWTTSGQVASVSASKQIRKVSGLAASAMPAAEATDAANAAKYPVRWRILSSRR